MAESQQVAAYCYAPRFKPSALSGSISADRNAMSACGRVHRLLQAGAGDVSDPSALAPAESRDIATDRSPRIARRWWYRLPQAGVAMPQISGRAHERVGALDLMRRWPHAAVLNQLLRNVIV